MYEGQIAGLDYDIVLDKLLGDHGGLDAEEAEIAAEWIAAQ